MGKRRGRGNNHGSMTYQITQTLKSKIAFGESRHEAKQELGSNNTPDKFYGIQHFRNTLNISIRFGKYVQAQGCKTIDEAWNKVPDYLKQTKESCKNTTYKTYRSALAKLYGTTSETLDSQLHQKFYSEVPYQEWSRQHAKEILRTRDTATRSRDYEGRAKPVGYGYSVKKHEDEIMFAKSVGCRRAEMQSLRPDNINIRDDGSVYIHLYGNKEARECGVPYNHTKGGKSRDEEVNPKAWDLCKQLKESVETRLFPHISRRAPLHTYRAEDMNAQYEKEARDIDTIRNKRMIMDKHSRVLQEYTAGERIPPKYLDIDGKIDKTKYCDKPAVYSCRGGKFSGVELDRLAMLKVAKSAGHNREHVFAQSYLRR